jgi:hypothetical protein
VDNSAPLATRRSPLKTRGNVVQTSGATSFPIAAARVKSPHADTALLIKLNEKTAEFEAKTILDYMPALLAIAGLQRPIELRINKAKKGNWQIVGFVYPGA